VRVRSCYFVIENDGTFWRLPKRALYRILQQRDDATHPEFAGQRVRYAQLDVCYEGDDAYSVGRATFHTLKFDAAGRLDEDDVLSQQQLAIQLLDDPDDIDDPRRREARITTVNEEFALRFQWTPTPELRELLFAAALGNKRSGGAVN
jgi:hypothetical protein